MYKAVIFDLDGVLIETEGIHITTMQQAFLDHGFEIDQEDLRAIVGRAPVEYIPEFLSKHNWSQNKYSEILESFRARFHPMWDKEVTLKSGVTDLLALLKEKDIQINLATNSSPKTVDKLINKFDLNNIFFSITTGSEVKKRKPDPEIYQISIVKTGIPAHEILAVEDSEVGLLSAKNAGLKVALVPNIYTKDQNFSQSDYMFQSLIEVSSLFNK